MHVGVDEVFGTDKQITPPLIDMYISAGDASLSS